MIHELLLALSGHPSPLLSPDLDNKLAARENEGIHSLLSPAELALLKTLSQDLGEKHRSTREHASKITTTHPSTTCRAVAAAVISVHLAHFRARILEVERSILKEDPTYVGAYNAVPLSAIVSAFDGWARKLQWLWDLVDYIENVGQSGGGGASSGHCTAALIIQRLRDSMHTGFPDLQSMALNLVETAEMAWLTQLSAWILYGRHPGEVEFFIKADESTNESSYNGFKLDASLTPCFVTPQTATSVLFVGKSLNHLSDRHSEEEGTFEQIDFDLLSAHLAHLSALKSPISASSFTAAVTAIRLSLSQKALQNLLPLSKVVETLHLLKDFFLLERGDFASALITAADTRLSQRHQAPEKRKPTGDIAQDLASLTIREGEVQGVLSRTWTALATMDDLDDDGAEDEELELAREVIALSIKGIEPQDSGHEAKDRANITTSFDDLLLPSPTILNMRISSPLDLFLAPNDMQTYSTIHSYLLAIRRSHLHLSQLFQLSRLRRQRLPRHISKQMPDPQTFIKSMRSIWAAVGSATSFLTDLSSYLQGEVVQSSWLTFQDWVVPSIEGRTGSGTTSLSASFRPNSSGHINSRPTSSQQSNEVTTYGIHDPETLAQAHRKFLQTLRHCLLLDDADFTSLLRRHMTAIDHLCGQLQRLETVHTHIHTTTKSSQPDPATTHLATEQRTLLTDLSSSTRKAVAEGTQKLIQRLRELDDYRANNDRYTTSTTTTTQYSSHQGLSMEDESEGQSSGFVPWTPPNGLDRLLLKLDYAAGEGEGSLLPAHFSGP